MKDQLGDAAGWIDWSHLPSAGLVLAEGRGVACMQQHSHNIPYISW